MPTTRFAPTAAPTSKPTAGPYTVVTVSSSLAFRAFSAVADGGCAAWGAREYEAVAPRSPTRALDLRLPPGRRRALPRAQLRRAGRRGVRPADARARARGGPRGEGRPTSAPTAAADAACAAPTFVALNFAAEVLVDGDVTGSLLVGGAGRGGGASGDPIIGGFMRDLEAALDAGVLSADFIEALARSSSRRDRRRRRSARR